jgi:hypothetical protein
MLCYYLYDMELKNQLEAMVGQEASVNSSPTLRAKLIKVLDNGKCMWEVVEGPWRSSDQFFHKIGTKFTLPMWISGNCFWGV